MMRERRGREKRREKGEGEMGWERRNWGKGRSEGGESGRSEEREKMEGDRKDCG